MKIFVLGMPESGRTTVAKEISQLEDHHYIDATSWARATFRDPKAGELSPHYQDEFHTWLINRMKKSPNMFVDNINNSISAYGDEARLKHSFVIDGLFSPHDFIKLFNYNKDIVVFLNRTNNQAEYKDYENIGISVMRDYCFWLASAELLDQKRWLEFNFTIPGEESDWVKRLGNKNSVYLVKSINKAVQVIKELLNLQDPQS